MSSDLVLWLKSQDPVVLVGAGFGAVVLLRLFLVYVEEVLARRAWFGRRLDRW